MEKYLTQHMVFVHGNLIKPLPFMSLSCDSFLLLLLLTKKWLKFYHLFSFSTTSMNNLIHIHNAIWKVSISKYECLAQSYLNARNSHSAVSLISLLTDLVNFKMYIWNQTLQYFKQTHKYTWIKTYLFTPKPSRVNNITSRAKS